MEQFRQVGEVLGSLKALMVLKDDIQINQRQCCLLLDIFSSAFNTIAEAIRLLLRSEEKNTKWKALEQPMRELHRVFKEGEHYVKQCLEYKDWWGKVISLHQNKDCVEFHIHNLLCYIPAVIEAIETAGEISGVDPDEMQRRRVALARKYDKDWNDPKLFQLRFGKEYLIPREFCSRFERAWKEDKWLLSEALKEKKRLGSVVLTKNEQRLVDMLLKKLNGSEPGNGKLFPSSILLGGKEYQVRRRLGGGSQYKEIQWLGDSFVLRHFYGELESLYPEISTLLSLSHPNIVQYLCGFCDEEKKEFFLIMELMSKDLNCYMRETFGARRRISFSIPIVVDVMLQIARGMEFLHSQKIYHGELNPSNIFLKAKSIESHFHVKVSGFGLSSKRLGFHYSSPPPTPSQNQNVPNPFIWYAPEVLADLEREGSITTSKYSEKADVYSFGMLCFELLSGKVPFEDGHLQGDKMSKNIRAGERPLFPSGSPKYLVNLIKRCWQTVPSQRPSFSSICRILRYIKKFMAINPDSAQSEFQSPLADYCDLEAGFVKQFVGEVTSPEVATVSQIPFQMFSYKIAEAEKAQSGNKVKQWELASDVASICKDEAFSVADDAKSAWSDLKSMKSFYSEAPGKKVSNFDMRSVCSEAPNKRMLNNVSRLVQSWVPEKTIPSLDTKSMVNIPISETKSMDPGKNISNSDAPNVQEEDPSSPDAASVHSIPFPEEKISNCETTPVSFKISENKVTVTKKTTGAMTKKTIIVKAKKGPGTAKERPARATRTKWVQATRSPSSQTSRSSPKSPSSPSPFVHCGRNSPKSPASSPFSPFGRSSRISHEAVGRKSTRRHSCVPAQIRK